MSPTTLASRIARFLPTSTTPRYVRVYDNEGETADRYTVVFTGQAATLRLEGAPNHYPYLAMGGSPFQPNGFCQHGETEGQACDTIRPGGGYVWPPALGRKNHLGTRIRFADLPADCQTAALRDYRAIWGIDEPEMLMAA
jgi:hypothetical protein